MATPAADETDMKAPYYGVCPICGYMMMPVLDLLPCGHSQEAETSRLDEAGKVYSWTKSHVGPDDMVMVMADFFDGELRVVAPLLGEVGAEIGRQVRLIEGSDTPYAFVSDS